MANKNELWLQNCMPGTLSGLPLFLFSMQTPYFHALLASVMLLIRQILYCAPKQQRGIMKTPPLNSTLQPKCKTCCLWLMNPFKRIPRAGKLLITCKTPLTQYGQAPFPKEMLLEWSCPAAPPMQSFLPHTHIPIYFLSNLPPVPSQLHCCPDRMRTDGFGAGQSACNDFPRKFKCC